MSSKDFIESLKYKIKRVLLQYPKAQLPLSYFRSRTRLAQSIFRREIIGLHEEKFIFIISCGRSGTTLLRRLLIENYAIYIPPETYILGSLVEVFQHASPLKWEDRVSLIIGKFQCHPEFDTFGPIDFQEVYKRAIGVPKDERSLGLIVKVFFEELGRASQIDFEWLGDKTPINFRSLGLIEAIFPRAKFIHLMRDPADVVYSIAQMGQHGDAESAARRWQDSIHAWRAFQQTIPEDRWVEIKYEELVTDTLESLEKIACPFGLPRREQKIFAGNSLGDVGIRPHHKKVLEPVNSISIGKGRSRLTNEERNSIAPIINKLAKKNGYDPV